MLNTGILGAAIEIAGFSIACFALVLSFSQRRLSHIYALLAFLFLALMLSFVSDISSFLLIDPSRAVSDRVIMLSYSSSFLIPPALLVYVRALTGQSLMDSSREALVHLTLPAIAVLVAMGFLALSEATRATFVTGQKVVPEAGFETTIAVALFILSFAFYLQCILYVLLTFSTQVKHRERLKELFASTEPYEIRWISGMAILYGSFAVLNLLSLASGLLGFQAQLPPLADSLLELLIVLTLAAWGLRQSPGISGQTAAPMGQNLSDHIKYEKSALDTNRAARISRKLQAAMENDQLFRDPNLSLMSLSKHIGVSTNYVSQSLNEHLGLSFFDFVNRWRVEASKPMILDAEQPITVIAYEVGFNSRSSFYTAFKKNTGMTPSKFSGQSANYAAYST